MLDTLSTNYKARVDELGEQGTVEDTFYSDPQTEELKESIKTTFTTALGNVRSNLKTCIDNTKVALENAKQ